MGYPGGVEWWAHQDLNLGPLGYEPIALTAELWARLKKQTLARKAIGKKTLCEDFFSKSAYTHSMRAIWAVSL